MTPFPTFRYHFLNDTAGKVYPSSSTTNATTTNGSWETLPGVAVSPPPGVYLVIFGGIMANSANNRVFIAVALDGQRDADSIAQVEVAADWRLQICTMAYVTVTEGQTITVQWKVSGGQATSYRRSIILQKLS